MFYHFSQNMQCFPSAASIQNQNCCNIQFSHSDSLQHVETEALSLRHCKHTHTHTRSDVAARSSRKSSYRGTILPLKMRNPSPPRVLCSIRKIHFHTHKLKRSGLAHRHSSARKNWIRHAEERWRCERVQNGRGSLFLTRSSREKMRGEARGGGRREREERGRLW